jgi:hypothetical protein
MQTTTTIRLDICTPAGDGKTWLAEVTGIDPKFGLAREFVRPVTRHTSRSGRTGWAEYVVSDGLYESHESRRRLGRRYWRVRDGRVEQISLDELLAELSERKDTVNKEDEHEAGLPQR